MEPPTGRRRREPAGAGRAGERTRQQPPPAGPGRLFFMPAPAPPGRHHRPPPAAADRDRPFFMPPPAPPGRSHSNQPPPADPPSTSTTTTRPAPPPPPPAPSLPPLPPHAYGDYDPSSAATESAGLRRPPNQTPLPPPHRLPRPSSPCSSALSSCLVATAFLLLSAGGAGAALFLLFRPRPPDISVAAVRLPSFSASNGTVAFTFEQTAAVRNPNRSPLAHFDSSLRVAYAGGELGAAVYIPAGLIGGGSTKHVSAVFDVPAIPVAVQPTMVAGAGADAASAAQQQQQQQSQAPAVIEVHSLLVVKGRVNVLRVLTHRVQASKLCRVGVSPLDGTVLGFRC